MQTRGNKSGKKLHKDAQILRHWLELIPHGIYNEILKRVVESCNTACGTFRSWRQGKCAIPENAKHQINKIASEVSGYPIFAVLVKNPGKSDREILRDWVSTLPGDTWKETLAHLARFLKIHPLTLRDYRYGKTPVPAQRKYAINKFTMEVSGFEIFPTVKPEASGGVSGSVSGSAVLSTETSLSR